MNHLRAYNAGATHPACAACKHQRKKCDERCLLSPYFPADKSREFQAVHRVFGVSNVTKMMLGVGEADRRQLMESLVREAYMRQRDPVLGIYGEYNRVLDELLYFKTLAQKSAVQLQQLQAHMKRISDNNNNNNGNDNNNVSTPSGHIVWNYRNNPVVNLGRAEVVMAAVTANEANNNNNPMTYARESESCIIDAIPYTSGIQNHLQIKNENQEREGVSPPLPPSSVGGFNQ